MLYLSRLYSKAKIIGFIIGPVLIIIGFQNCSSGGFTNTGDSNQSTADDGLTSNLQRNLGLADITLPFLSTDGVSEIISVPDINGDRYYAAKLWRDSKAYVAMFKIRADGTLDSAFGINGLFTFDFNLGVTYRPTSLVWTKDQSLLVAGWNDTQTNSYQENNYNISIIKVSKSGQREMLAGINGVLVVDPNPATGTGPIPDPHLVIQADGKIIMAARGTVGSQPGDPFGLLVYRFNENGTVDSAFGSGGLVGIPNFMYYADSPKGFHRNIKSLLLLTSGDIVVATANEPIGNGSPLDMVLLKITQNGIVDTGFSSPLNNVNAKPGISYFDFNGGYENAFEMLEDNDGNIIVGFDNLPEVSNSELTPRKAYLVKISVVTGQIITSFGSGGVVSLPESTCSLRISLFMLRDSSNHLIFISRCKDNTNIGRIEIMRTSLSGQIDTDFGISGWVFINPFNSSSGYIRTFDLRQAKISSNNLLISGFVKLNDTNNKFSIGSISSTGVLLNK